MKHTAILLSGLALLLSCGQPKTAQTVTKDQLTFPFGNRLPSPPFTGEAYIQPMIGLDDVFNFPTTNNITFAPGAHSTWHRHGGMVVMVTGGVGLYQEEGKPAQILRQGDVLEIPAGVRHWHGATPDSWFSQIVIYDSAWRPEETPDQVGGDDTHGRDDDTLSDEDYGKAAASSLPARPAIPGDARSESGMANLMFATPDSPVTLPTFNGPIRLANTLGTPNVAGAPGLHYVVFEPGVYNAWHTHAGGQVLIVTDGVGYHQIEGQPVEVLHPGDVAKCPPGVKHWHGAAPGSRFAHLAANTNPDKPGVEWFDLLPEEEYNALPEE